MTDSKNRTRKSVRWWALNVVALFAFGGVMAVVVWQRRSEIAEIFDDPGWELAALGVLVVAGHFINSAEFWLLFRAQGVGLGLGENWMVFTAGQLGNLAPGQVGTLYKFRYLKVVHQLPYSKSSSNYGTNLVITLASSAVSGLVGVAGVWATGGKAAWWLVAGLVGLAVAACLLFTVQLPDIAFLPGKVRSAWLSAREGWDELRRSTRTAVAVFGLDLCKYVLVAIRFQIAFSLLGVDEGFWYFLVIAPAAALAGMLAFTPGGLGFRELFVTVAAVGVGNAFDTGLLAATVDRGVMLLSSVVLGGIGYIYTARRMAAATAAVSIS